jgi:hypothetical protein
MTEKRVAELTVEELKEIIAAVVDKRFSEMKVNLLEEISDLIDFKEKRREQALVYQDAYVLPKRTEEQQHQINQDLIEWYREWSEEGNEEEQRETLEYLQNALDEDRLSNRPLFPQK